MKYVSTLLAVRDMGRSRQFYHDVLGLDVVADFGANALLSGGVALQTADTWRGFIQTDAVTFRHNAGELYFEERDMDGFLRRLEDFTVEYVHPLKEHRWGQRVVRFYDPDGHIIEVGEEMTVVARRFRDSGMTDAQVAARMDVPLDYAKALLKP